MSTETYDIPCADGSDPNCEGTLEVELDEGLTQEEAVEAAAEQGDDVCSACGSDYTRDSNGNIVD